jgi:hypothetical protein
MKVTKTYQVQGEGDDAWHIPGVHNSQLTLCGFVDVSYEEADFTDHPCDCSGCIKALKKIQALRFPKGYFTGEEAK